MGYTCEHNINKFINYFSSTPDIPHGRIRSQDRFACWFFTNQTYRMEEAKTEEQFLVFVLFLAAIKLLLCDQVI